MKENLHIIAPKSCLLYDDVTANRKDNPIVRNKPVQGESDRDQIVEMKTGFGFLVWISVWKRKEYRKIHYHEVLCPIRESGSNSIVYRESFEAQILL